MPADPLAREPQTKRNQGVSRKKSGGRSKRSQNPGKSKRKASEKGNPVVRAAYIIRLCTPPAEREREGGAWALIVS